MLNLTDSLKKFDKKTFMDGMRVVAIVNAMSHKNESARPILVPLAIIFGQYYLYAETVVWLYKMYKKKNVESTEDKTLNF